VDRIPAAAEQSGLRARSVERNAEREHLAGANQAHRPHDVLGQDVIERADLIVFAPAPPVFEFLGSVCDRLPADRDVHSGALPPTCSASHVFGPGNHTGKM
jgi:hypothetical protein